VDKISQLILLADVVTPDHDVFAQVHHPTGGTLTENLVLLFLFGKWLIMKICFMRYRPHCCGASQNGGMILMSHGVQGKQRKTVILLYNTTVQEICSCQG